jgi:hypothetical protein
MQHLVIHDCLNRAAREFCRVACLAILVAFLCALMMLSKTAMNLKSHVKDDAWMRRVRIIFLKLQVCPGLSCLLRFCLFFYIFWVIHTFHTFLLKVLERMFVMVLLCHSTGLAALCFRCFAVCALALPLPFS